MKQIRLLTVPSVSLDHTRSHQSCPISFPALPRVPGRRAESRQHSCAAGAGSGWSSCPRLPPCRAAELLVVATAGPAPVWVMLLSLEPGNGMVPQGPKQRAAQREEGKEGESTRCSQGVSDRASLTPWDQQETLFSLSLPAINQFYC